MAFAESLNVNERFGAFEKLAGNGILAVTMMTESCLNCPLNPETGAIEGSIIEAQAEQAIKNLGEILKAAGTDFSKVVKTTCFLAHISDFAAFNAVYEKYFVSKPARSCFEVSALPKGALVEIEAVAVTE